MIQCPYCGADMDDNARSCPKCLSLLVAEPDHGAHQPYPVWRHPATALIVILVLSAGLLLASLKLSPAASKGKDGPAEKKAAEAPKGNAATGPATAPPNPANPQPPGPPAPAAPPGPPNKYIASGDAPSFEEFTAYETSVTAVFTETDALTAEIDKLFNQSDDKAAAQLAEKTKQLQLEVQKIRRIDSPKPLNPLHSKLANSLSMLSRGYQEISRFQKSGDTARLAKSRKDIETSRQKRQDALTELASYKATLKPSEAAPEPPATDTKPPEPAPPPSPAPPPGPPPPGERPKVDPEGGTDNWGACIPRRLVEVYPAGKIRVRIIDGLKGQYNSTRLCGDAPGQPAPATPPAPPAPQPPPPATDNPPQPPGPNGPDNPPPSTDNPDTPDNPPGPDQPQPQPDAPQP